MKKMKVANVNTLMCTIMALSYPRSVQGPVTLHWGPLNWSLTSLWGKKVEAQEGKLCACLALYEVHNILLIFQYTQPLERKALSPRVGIPVEDTSLAEAQAKFWGK